MSYCHKYPEHSSVEYRAWRNINCSMGSSSRYYKDIEIFPDWQHIKGDRKGNDRRYNNFLSFIGRRPQGMFLGRIDKSSGYIPGNIRWMTVSELQKNKRPYAKFSYARDEELINELRRRGYTVNDNT